MSSSHSNRLDKYVGHCFKATQKRPIDYYRVYSDEVVFLNPGIQQFCSMQRYADFSKPDIRRVIYDYTKEY